MWRVLRLPIVTGILLSSLYPLAYAQQPSLGPPAESGLASAANFPQLPPLASLDLPPAAITSAVSSELSQQKLAELVKQAALQPVISPNFRITQHVDYFPWHDGLRPVLPMAGLIEWTGPGRGPEQLHVLESVQDETVSTTILEREIQAHWDGRSLTWERDGQLRPGHYTWRIVVHDGNGKILATAEDKISVVFPDDASVGISSLVLGKSCRDESQSASGLRHRSSTGAASLEETRLQIDPMRASDCRLKPDSAGSFASSDMLHAFVRIYPTERLEKHRPESWTAKFLLRSQSGSVEIEREIHFTIDSGSGYVASIAMPLNMPAISSGPHTLDVETSGPGIHRDLKTSRTISIAAP